MNLAINAASAKMGGAATYLQNVLPPLRSHLAGDSATNSITVWKPQSVVMNGEELEGINYRILGAEKEGKLKRLFFDQVELPQALKKERADILFSSANFGTLFSPCRQVLLVRNTIPFDRTYQERVSQKVRLFCQLQRRLILQSIKAADVVLFPSQAMLDMVNASYRGRTDRWFVATYGTRHDLFSPREPQALQSPINILNVGTYSDQKNLGVLLQAMRELTTQSKDEYTLRLTAGFQHDWIGDNPSFPNFHRDQTLYGELAAAGIAEDTNWRNYGSLPDLYRSADIFVFPSYTESFGHPLLEAMASGLPIVAADIPVNRELCGEAAMYFSPFNVNECASLIKQVANDNALRHKLAVTGLERVKRFTWQSHVGQLVKAFSAN